MTTRERKHNLRSAWHEAHLAPRALPQADGSLPPLGVLVVDDDGDRVQCHVCGEYFVNLGRHVGAHGLSANMYRDQFGLSSADTLVSPAFHLRLMERPQTLALTAGHPAPYRKPLGTPAALSTRLKRSRAFRGRYRVDETQVWLPSGRVE